MKKEAIVVQWTDSLSRDENRYRAKGGGAGVWVWFCRKGKSDIGGACTMHAGCVVSECGERVCAPVSGSSSVKGRCREKCRRGRPNSQKRVTRNKGCSKHAV